MGVRSRKIEAIIRQEFKKVDDGKQSMDEAMRAIERRIAPVKKLYTEYQW
jgi:hypothetical protein